MAMKISTEEAVSIRPKYTNPNTPMVAQPIMYIFLRPMTSDM